MDALSIAGGNGLARILGGRLDVHAKPERRIMRPGAAGIDFVLAYDLAAEIEPAAVRDLKKQNRAIRELARNLFDLARLECLPELICL